MFSSIRKFLSKPCGSVKQPVVFSQEYREGYNRTWVNSIKDYCP